MTTGLFITLEGGEGAGKSVQAGLLARALRRRGLSVVLTREPGGTALAEKVRRALLDPRRAVAPWAEVFLYEAARAQHVAEVIGPSLRAGKAVVCDRFTDATLAYQGWGRGLPVPALRRLNAVAADGLRPDLTLLLDAPVAGGLARARGRGQGGDRMEREAAAFHQRVRRGYLALARREPRRFRVVPWVEGPDRVHARVWAEVELFLKKKR